MQKRATNHFLHFTKKEKNGTVFLLFIIFLLIVAPFIYSFFFKEKNIDAGRFKSEIAVLKIRSADSSERSYKKNDAEGIYPRARRQFGQYEYSSNMNLFYFDPNTLSENGWKKLGVREKTIATIQNYLSKGGRFKEPGDIRKIWGLHEDQIEKMLPYIRIEQTAATAAPNFPVYEKTTYPKTEISIVDVNHADSTSYISLPGIGPGFAKRILKFRDKLGGFYKIEQVSETFALPDSTFQKIKNYLRVSGEDLRKININTATVEELKEHPYIRYMLANAIIQYRTQHGNFSTVDDIKKIMLVTDEVFVKLAPYLTVK
ncbi:MAG: helix-hairpin-helix domain-containing protein [Ferruginibacter sp.]